LNHRHTKDFKMLPVQCVASQSKEWGHSQRVGYYKPI